MAIFTEIFPAGALAIKPLMVVRMLGRGPAVLIMLANRVHGPIRCGYPIPGRSGAAVAETVEQLAQFARDAAQLDDMSAMVERVITYAQKLAGTHYAGIALYQAGGRFRTVGATAPVVEEADRLQYEYREGPCVRGATDPGTHVLMSGDIAADARWPRWGPAAAELGLRSVLSAELSGRNRRIGALNLYGEAARQFGAEDLATAHLFAAHASLALAAATTTATLQDALDTRTSIGQAQGILMERFVLAPEQAFAVLRRYSQTNNVKLHDIADTLIHTRYLPGRGPAEDTGR